VVDTSATNRPSTSEVSEDNATDEAVEAAAQYVQHALSLQVSKSGGLLTFNGVAAAVATFLFTNSALNNRFLDQLLLILLGISSVLSLGTIYVFWGNPPDLGVPRQDLERLLKLEVRRGVALNIAVMLSMLGVGLLAFSFYKHQRPESAHPQKNDEAPLVISGDVAPEMTSKFALRLDEHCVLVPQPTRKELGTIYHIECN
jgi:hypothetical protein